MHWKFEKQDGGIDIKKPLTLNIVQFLKFGIVGISNTFIFLSVYYIFLWINSKWYLLGNVVGWIVSVANAFLWNNKYVFQSKFSSMGSLMKKLGKTYISYGATFLLSTLLLYLEVDVLGWSMVVSPIGNLMITIPLNFLLNKLWAFN